MVSAEVKKLRKQICELKKELKECENYNVDLNQQRNKHREFIVSEFINQQSCKNNEYWSSKIVMARIAKHMAATGNWYW